MAEELHNSGHGIHIASESSNESSGNEEGDESGSELGSFIADDDEAEATEAAAAGTGDAADEDMGEGEDNADEEGEEDEGEEEEEEQDGPTLTDQVTRLSLFGTSLAGALQFVSLSQPDGLACCEDTSDSHHWWLVQACDNMLRVASAFACFVLPAVLHALCCVQEIIRLRNRLAIASEKAWFMLYLEFLLLSCWELTGGRWAGMGIT
jgi:hypothetical protein